MAVSLFLDCLCDSGLTFKLSHSYDVRNTKHRPPPHLFINVRLDYKQIILVFREKCNVHYKLLHSRPAPSQFRSGLGARRKTARTRQVGNGQDIVFAIIIRYKRVMPKMPPTKHLTTVVNSDN